MERFKIGSEPFSIRKETLGSLGMYISTTTWHNHRRGTRELINNHHHALEEPTMLQGIKYE